MHTWTIRDVPLAEQADDKKNKPRNESWFCSMCVSLFALLEMSCYGPKHKLTSRKFPRGHIEALDGRRTGWLTVWFDWLTGWLVGWLGWLAGWVAGWLGGWMAGWLDAWMAGCRKWRDDLVHGWLGACPRIETDIENKQMQHHTDWYNKHTDKYKTDIKSSMQIQTTYITHA